jgi:prepilin-type N-terminal cleavage/methylation domain-containing protein
MKNPAKKFSGSGFTLIELLVSMAITTVIITSLVSITMVALDIWNRSRSEVRATLQSKAMVESMAADFESMVVRSGNSFQWLYAKSAPPSNGPNDGSNQSPNAVDLIFFSAATDRYDGQIGVTGEDNGGDVSAIAYQLAYKNPIGSVDEDKFKTFILYRKIVDPKPAFENLLGKTELKSDFDTYSATDAVDASENFICENIYQFTVTFLIDVVDTDGNIVSIPVTINQATASEEFVVTGNGLEVPTMTGLPTTVDQAALESGRLTSVEVFLSVITDAGLAQMKRRTFGTDSEELQDLLAEHSYQYSKVIPVPSY